MSQNLPKTLFEFSLYFFKKWPVSFIFFFIAPLALILEANFIPYMLKLVIDAISTNENNREFIYSLIKNYLLLGGAAWVILIIVLRLQGWWQGYIIPKFQAEIRMSVLKHVTKHSYNYFTNQLSGNLANKINDLARAIESIRMIVTWNVISTAAITIVAASIMATINLYFSLILIFWVIFTITIVISRVKNVNQISKINAEDKSQLSGVIVDILNNILSVKLFARDKYEQHYAQKKQEQEQVSNKKLIITTNFYWLYVDIPIIIMLAVLIYYLINSWRLNHITTGDFVFIFNSSFIIMNQLWHLSWSLMELLKDIGIARQALALVNVDNEVVDDKNAKEININNGLIEFKNVSFHYQNGSKIFNNKNIVINSGENIGLVGFSGSGKSTFVNLILRFFDVESGSIEIDGQNIVEVTQESLRHNISMIPQDTSLFHRTLFENINYGNPDASDDSIIKASKMAHCHEFISKLNNGYDTLVGERGVKLSGGQRQRIAIARAMLENAPILILDEATSALDSITEKQIQEGLMLLMKNRTTIVVAHRLSTLLHMDRILVFDNGKIIEDGSHQQLLDMNGHYAKLWKMQIGGFLPEQNSKL